MKKHQLLIIMLVAIFSINLMGASSETEYYQIGEVNISDIMATAKGGGKFADTISPGSSMIVVAGVMAIMFKYPMINFSKGVNVLIYGQKGKSALIDVAMFAKPLNAKNISSLKLNKEKYPVKTLDDFLVIAGSKSLLNSIKSIPKLSQNDSSFKLDIAPSKYLKESNGSIESIYNQLEKFSKKQHKLSPKEKKNIGSAEKFFKQCADLSISLNLTGEQFKCNIILLPEKDSLLAKEILSKNGNISPEELFEIASKVSGSKDIAAHNLFTQSVSKFIKLLFPNSKSDNIAHDICDFSAISKDGKLFVNLSISAEKTHKVLDAAGLLKKRERHR